MTADLDMDARLNGGFFAALAKKFLGGESLFINVFTNNGQERKRLTLTQGTPSRADVPQDKSRKRSPGR